MGWPQSQDYNEAIQNAKSCFKDPELSKGAAVTNPLGMPLPCSGNFADVYQVHCPDTNTRWAVKCFTRGDPKALEDRYAKIDQHLQQAKLPFAVGFRYLVEGIRVRKEWHPVLKMQWVEGFTLNHFVRDNLDKPNVLDALLQIWVRMGKRLREADMAHADLQHGNVLLVPGSTSASLAVKLIDYDGMWVPTLAGQKSGEVGHPAYQHTKRLYEGTYSKEVDRFPLLVVATALRCLRVAGRPLWEKFDNGDNLLFREADMAAPEKSPLFAELAKIPDAQAQKLIEAVRASCDLPLEQCPHLDELYSGLPPKSKQATAALAQPEAVFAEFGNPDSPSERTSRRTSSTAAMSPAVKKWAVIGGGVGTALLALILVIALAGGKKGSPKDKSGALVTKDTPTSSKSSTNSTLANRPEKKDGKRTDKPVSPPRADWWDNFKLANAEPTDGHIKINPPGGIVSKSLYSGPIDITVVAMTEGKNIRLDACKGSCVIFNWEVNERELRVTRPDGNEKQESGSLATAPVTPLLPNTWYTLRWEISRDGMKVLVDNNIVFTEIRKNNDLSGRFPIGIRSCDHAVHVKSIQVNAPPE